MEPTSNDPSTRLESPCGARPEARCARRRARARGALGLALVAAIVSGCGSDSGGPTAPPPRPLQPARVAVHEGDTQMATVGAPVPVPPSVRIASTDGSPTPGVTVRFEVVAGGGSVAGSPAISDASGVASIERWTLGTAAGRNELRAIVAGMSSVSFEAFGTPSAPKAVAAVQGDGQSAAAGATLPVSPVVVVRDTFANPVPGVTVTFSVQLGRGSIDDVQPTTDSAGVASVGGWRLGPGVGEQRLLATVAGLPSVTFSATAGAGAAANAVANAGNGQTAPVGTPVSARPAVRVTDQNGNGVPGIEVTFSAASGGGSVSGAIQNTNVAGIATVGSWTLGATPGPNSLAATVTGGSIAGNPVTFNATGTGPIPAYDIVIRFNAGSSPTTAQRQAFDAAEARWERVVVGDLPDVSVSRPTGTCSSTSPIDETVDDLLIFVTVEPIDGPGGVLGSAGPCLIRSGSNLPLAGNMRFDTADLAGLESRGLLEEVALHEMGHVLGVGSLWKLFGFLADASQSGGLDPHFTGSQTIAAFNAMGGSGYMSAKVPVEDTGGSGTADMHWREAIFDKEVMTGWIDSGTNPLSEVTVSSLADHGYTIDPSSADPMSLSFSASIVPRPGVIPTALLLFDDVAHGPVEVVDSRGRTERVLPR